MRNKEHKLKSAGINPYGYLCYCLICGKNFGDYKDAKREKCKSRTVKEQNY